MGHRQTTAETPKSLAELARQLKAFAADLEGVSEKMLLAGAHGPIDVRHGPGLYAALRDTIGTFIADARVKASRAIDAEKAKRRKK